jgi:hypothetical protein
MDCGSYIVLGQDDSTLFFGPGITLMFPLEEKQQLDALQQKEQLDALRQREQLRDELYKIKSTIVQPEYKTLITREVRLRVHPSSSQLDAKNRTFVILSPPQFRLLTMTSSTSVEGEWALGIHIQGWIQDFRARYHFDPL